jgi:hypothetical protein
MAGEQRPGQYARPRVLIALALTGLLIVLLLLDVASRDYSMSELTLTAILGAILTLLGIEVADLIRGGKR